MCWALPQHQPLELDVDGFHAELVALLDRENGGTTRTR